MKEKCCTDLCCFFFFSEFILVGEGREGEYGRGGGGGGGWGGGGLLAVNSQEFPLMALYCGGKEGGV